MTQAYTTKLTRFLNADDNKWELSHIISEWIVDGEFPIRVTVTCDDKVLLFAPHMEPNMV